MKALLHVHSNHSYDGVASLASLAEWGETRGLDAIFLSEHTNDFDAAKMGRFVAECDALADRRCRLVPGLEFSVAGGFHILGYSLREFLPRTNPADVVEFIHDRGGIAVLAHPARYRGKWPAATVLERMDGIEAWNARYDGRFVPSGAVLAACGARLPGLGRPVLFGGQDLHELTSHRLVVTSVPRTDDLPTLLLRLRDGDSTFGAGLARLKSRERPARIVVSMASVLHTAYRGARRFRRSVGPRPASSTPRP